MAGGARGWVLELGIGAGANLPHYRAPACVAGLDARPDPLRVAAAEALAVAFPVALVCARAEALPFPDHSFDAVVTALVFCSVADPAAALAEAARVLRPGGELRLVEHVLPAGGPMRALITWILPLWNRISHECRLDRDTLTALRQAGFTVRELRKHVGGLFVEVVAESSSGQGPRGA